MSRVTQSTIEFASDRFSAAVLHVIACVADEPERLGRSRLHAALYYADMCAYIERARPITGAEYVKESFGPAAKALNVALDYLQAEGLVTVERAVKHGVPKYVFGLTAAGEIADATNILSHEEKSDIGFWTRWLCGFLQADLGDVGLRRPWESVRKLGDTIPYATAFMMLPKPAFTRELQRTA